LALGCGAPPSELPDGEALRYGVSHMSGDVSFVVRADGSADYRREGGGEAAIAVSAKVSQKELAALVEVLRARDFCNLSSSRDTGVPDEARPTIAVHLEDLDCKVVLWDGEFRDDDDARVCLAAVEALGATVRKRGRAR
jgi:hypothetical protein